MSNQISLRILRAEADAFDPDPPELSPPNPQTTKP